MSSIKPLDNGHTSSRITRLRDPITTASELSSVLEGGESSLLQRHPPKRQKRRVMTLTTSIAWKRRLGSVTIAENLVTFRGTVTRRDQEEEECVEEAMVGEEDMAVEEGGEAERSHISEAWKWMRR